MSVEHIFKQDGEVRAALELANRRTEDDEEKGGEDEMAISRKHRRFFDNSADYEQWELHNSLILYPEDHKATRYVRDLFLKISEIEEWPKFRIFVYQGTPNAVSTGN